MALDLNKTYTFKGSVLAAALTAAAVGGYAAGEAELAGEAQALTTDRVKGAEVQLSPAALSSIAGIINTEWCPAFEAEHGMTPGVCTAAKLMARMSGGIVIAESCTAEAPCYTLSARARVPVQVIISDME